MQAAPRPIPTAPHVLEPAPRIEEAENPEGKAQRDNTSPLSGSAAVIRPKPERKDHLRPMACFSEESLDAPFEDSLALEGESRMHPMVLKILGAAVIMGLASASALWAVGSPRFPF
ncbi:MAG: hypothetical protein K9H25_14670 [Rhodospirillum sp.]|nr:hypothetical protein [Rhodospirillum sp.]MCF8490536.1 hypothetical protein [Rhodospirillum sp.]MCF8502146.1 hypothetical protein [Rhodospirillum sp.]